jgi:hypothetical protein
LERRLLDGYLENDFDFAFLFGTIRALLGDGVGVGHW